MEVDSEVLGIALEDTAVAWRVVLVASEDSEALVASEDMVVVSADSREVSGMDLEAMVVDLVVLEVDMVTTKVTAERVDIATALTQVCERSHD